MLCISQLSQLRVNPGSMTEEAPVDPLLGPFTSLEQRKIPIQDDKYRGLLLLIYSCFILVGVPIWWYYTNVPSIQLPADISYGYEYSQRFNVNLYNEKDTSDVHSSLIDIDSFSFSVKSRGTLQDLEQQREQEHEAYGFNLVVSENDNVINGLRISPSEDIETVLRDIVAGFKIPNLRTSKIKVKFTLLTSEANNHFDNESFDNIRNFLSLLAPVVSFETSFQVKYFDPADLDGELSAEMFTSNQKIAKIDSRDQRGGDQVYNFVFINGIKAKDIYIPNWGMVQCDFDVKKTLTGLRRLLGFDGGGNARQLPEMVEIDLWKTKLNEFYLQKCSEMLELLKNDVYSVIPPEVYKSKLLPAIFLLKSNNPKEAFDLLNSVVHDPKLMAAAYFPDDHKFAVYLPVYLPLCLPIFVALLTFLKEHKKSNKKKKEESDVTISKKTN